jgi:hypothetical protein
MYQSNLDLKMYNMYQRPEPHKIRPERKRDDFTIFYVLDDVDDKAQCG